MSECTCLYGNPDLHKCPLCKAAPELYAALDEANSNLRDIYMTINSLREDQRSGAIVNWPSVVEHALEIMKEIGADARAALDMVKP